MYDTLFDNGPPEKKKPSTYEYWMVFRKHAHSYILADNGKVGAETAARHCSDLHPIFADLTVSDPLARGPWLKMNTLCLGRSFLFYLPSRVNRL